MSSLCKLVTRSTILKSISLFNYECSRGFRENAQAVFREIKKRQLRAGPRPVNHRNTFIEWNYNAELYSFGKRLGEEFNDELLRTALTDRSYLIKLEEEQKKVGIESSVTEEVDNRHMVPKGEEILNDFILLYLRHVLPRFPEEGIQSIKNYLMSEEILSYVSSHIGTAELILCADFPVANSTLINVLKALIFALQESSGLERTSLFIRDFILTQIAEQDINDLWDIPNPIEKLNTICRNECVNLPEPRIVGHSGVNTILGLYRVGLYIDKRLIGLGPGETVKIAHEIAALDALRRLFQTAEHQLNIPFDLILNPRVKSLPNVNINDWCEKRIQEQSKQISSSQ